MRLQNALSLSIAILLLAGCEIDTTTKKLTLEEKMSQQYDLALANQALDLFEPIAAVSNSVVNDPKVSLGKTLYFDKRLSKDGNISCNSCHNLSTYGVDNLPTSPGDDGTLGGRNSPTVLNAFMHSSQFWDGRAKDVEEQAGMPIMNPVEMGIPSKDFLINRLRSIETYQDLFVAAYPNQTAPITYSNLQEAIGAFERTLITPSRFDDYLKGSKEALTLQEKKGFLSFIIEGCVTCHAGKAMGGDKFQKFGVYDQYWKHTKSAKIDDGLFDVSKKESDKYIFKVPSLRNVAQTHPYFHDGSVRDLGKAIKIMAEIQLDKELSDEKVENMVAFLHALTGEVPAFAREEK